MTKLALSVLLQHLFSLFTSHKYYFMENKVKLIIIIFTTLCTRNK